MNFDKELQRRIAKTKESLDRIMTQVRLVEASIRQKLKDHEIIQVVEATSICQIDYILESIPFTKIQLQQIEQLRASTYH